MMFRPRWPSAGPMGGDGLALPAGTCSLIKPTIFFATIGSYRVPAPSPRARLLVALNKLNLLDLREIQLHRRCATEDGDRHAHLGFVVVDFLDRAVEVGERAFLDAHQLSHDPFDLGRGFSMPSCIWCTIFITSASEIGAG